MCAVDKSSSRQQAFTNVCSIVHFYLILKKFYFILIFFLFSSNNYYYYKILQVKKQHYMLIVQYHLNLIKKTKTLIKLLKLVKLWNLFKRRENSLKQHIR